MPGIIFDNNDVLCEESGDRSMFPTLAETLMSSCLFFYQQFKRILKSVTQISHAL